MKAVQILSRIEKQFNENKNSHVFLFKTNNMEAAVSDVKGLIKNILKTKNIELSQIDNETYIELLIIRPEGNSIRKDQILLLQEKVKIKPILSNYYFYVIVNAEQLNDIASNKLLKTIEEPNENTIGFLISENLDIMLPTIKSRCEINTLYYDEDANDNLIDMDNIDKITAEFIKIIEGKTLLEFNLYKNSDKIKKDFIKENGKLIANRIKEYYNTACNVSYNDSLKSDVIKYIKEMNSYNSLIFKAKYLNKTLNRLTANMNTDLLLDKIFIELKDVNKNGNGRN